MATTIEYFRAKGIFGLNRILLQVRTRLRLISEAPNQPPYERAIRLEQGCKISFCKTQASYDQDTGPFHAKF